MKKIIRPTGLLGFLAVVGLVAALAWLLSGWLLKTAIEQGGSQLVGAKVEVDDAAIQFNPLGFEITHLQVTDPEHPMRNMVEFASINGHMDLGKLLTGNVIIDQLNALGMRLDTARQSSGALPKAAPPTKEEKSSESESAMPDLLAMVQDNINVDDILAREPLSTLELGKAFQESTQQAKQSLKDNIAALPSENNLKEYELEVRVITEGRIQSLDDINQRIDRLKQLKQSLKQDRQNFITLRDNIRQTRVELKQQFETLKQAPQKDLDKIRAKYSLESGNLGNFSKLLFGDRIDQWLATLRPWWDRSQQVVQAFGDEEPPPPPRGEGRYIHFATLDPLPDFLIRHAQLTAELPAGKFDVTVTDATHQPDILGRPMQIGVSGIALNNMQAFDAKAVLDRTKPKTTIDTLDFNVHQLGIQDLALVKSDQLPLVLNKAQSEIQGQLTVTDGQLAGKVNAQLSNVAWQSKEQSSKTLMDILNGIDQFNVDSHISGHIRSPKLALNSDLDNKLRKGLDRKIAERREQLKRKLEQRLHAEIDKLVAPYQEQLALLQQGEGDLNQKLDRIEKLLKAEVDSAIEAKRQAIKDRIAQEEQRARDKIAEEKRQAEEALRKKEEEAHAKAEEEKRKAEEKAEQEKKAAEERLRKKAEEKLKNLKF